MPKAKLTVAPPKKEHGTVDKSQVYYWTSIRKNRSKYNLARGISEDDVTRILLHQVIVDSDVQKAETSLLQLPGLRKFISTLRSDREREDFRRHMRKYIDMWLPDCPFEVSTTNRYTIVTHEAAVIARRQIKRGETVKYLVGNLVAMTPEEEKDLDLTRRDFSIVFSSRRKTPSLFLGPARFANHDCNANARLVTRGSEGMQVIASRDISLDEEITVTYGDNYFGDGNCECLCSSCEIAGRGAWTGSSSNAYDTPLSDDRQKSSTRSLRASTRKRSRTDDLSTSPGPHLDSIKRPRTRAAGRSSNSTAQPSEYAGRGLLRTKRKRALSDDEPSLADAAGSLRDLRKRTKFEASERRESPAGRIPKGKVPGSLKVMGYRTPESSGTCVTRPMEKALSAQINPPVSPVVDSIFDELSAALKKKPSKIRGRVIGDFPAFQDISTQSVGNSEILELVPPTPADTACLGFQAIEKPAETPASSTDHDSIFDHNNAQISSPVTTPRLEEEQKIKSLSSLMRKPNSSDSDLSELDPDVQLDDSSKTVLEKTPVRRKRAARGSKIIPTIEIEDASLRIPGDYVRTSLLLGEKFSRWVDCQTCFGCWVQPNGYQTRKECPRCERHSKLYGFQWPKTEKLDEDDEEERVMDHRTVHRFVKPTEERLLVKRGKGTKHTTANFEIDFENKKLCGNVILKLESISDAESKEILLDTSYVDIKNVALKGDILSGWQLLPRFEPYGSALKISLEKEVEKGQSLELDIQVETTDKCTALQWLTPAQASSKKYPYMFSQCQAIHARSLFPCQDTPDIKSTFDFNIRSPLPVITSGISPGVTDPKPSPGGKSGKTSLYTFKQDIPIPSYLFALASGDIATAPIGPRSTVATRPEALSASQWELSADTEHFIQTAEKLVYPYAWQTYNVLILPPSFPYGGMENPVFTFATPTIVSGDRQNVDVIAHELSHSWSGNLVSNASWEHFWLNEGWTTYLERRIQAAVHGEPHRDFSAIIGWKALSDSIAQFGEEHEFTKLVIDLKGKDPDDAFSSVPYEKGFHFLYYLEKLLGKGKWDTFVPHYFTKFKGQSLDSYDFRATVAEFFAEDEEAGKALKGVDWDAWFYSPGFPPKPDFDTSLVDVCYSLADKWKAYSNDEADGKRFEPQPEDIESWMANQVVVFLERIQSFGEPMSKDAVHVMGSTYGFAKSKNVEIVSRYLAVGLMARSEEVLEPTAELLGKVGRMKFVRPL
ncbi:MAG: hypothetical protein Q9219_001167 [cf. Caloplaca sp. 3 TL-2023]